MVASRVPRYGSPMQTGTGPRGVRPWRAALAGALAAGVAIAESELLAGVTGSVSLVDAVGALVIAHQPRGAEALMIVLFGDRDKAALGVIVILVGMAVGAVAGVIAARDVRAGAAVFAAVGVVAGYAAAQVPLVSLGTAAMGAVLAVLAGLATLRWLLGLAGRTSPGSGGGAENAAGGPSRAGGPTRAGEPSDNAGATVWDRRRFILASAGTLGGVIVATGMGRAASDATAPQGPGVARPLPRPVVPVADPGAGQVVTVPGITPLVTPAGQLYRTDIALSIPRVDADLWRLEVNGMVDHPLTLTYDDLLAMPLFEQYATIACVSNEVGGHLVGTPLWTGVRLKDILAEAGVQPGATQVMGRSWSDFSAGFPTAWAMAPGREPMIALGVDRDVLPAVHGFPARLVVPGLYGYASATKWLTQIELTTLEAQDGFWVPLGWAKLGAVLTQSRIDVPSYGARLAAGAITVAGVAWAPDRGVRAVEVRFDGGPWLPAQVSRPLSAGAWVQWTATWTATPGEHGIEVRATDGTGEVQTDAITRPTPDGARGHHRVVVTVG